MISEMPYTWSLGLVTEHQEEPSACIIRIPDGRVIGCPANGACSPESIEADRASPPRAPVEAPLEIPIWRLRAIASIAGLASVIATALGAIEEPASTVATEVWHYGNTIHRDSALVAQLGAVLGLTIAQLDAHFIQTAALPT